MKGGKIAGERKRRIQSPARASFREIKRFRRRRRRRRENSATSRARLVLRWYVQRCNGTFKTGIISGRASISSSRRNALDSPPCMACNERAYERAYVGSALNFPRAGLHRPVGSNSHANPSLSAAGWARWVAAEAAGPSRCFPLPVLDYMKCQPLSPSPSPFPLPRVISFARNWTEIESKQIDESYHSFDVGLNLKGDFTSFCGTQD